MRRLRRDTSLLALSPVYRTDPQGFAEQPPFLNLAAQVHTLRSPFAFKTAVIDKIETALGRVRDPGNKNAPRTIDIDIALWNNEVEVLREQTLAYSRSRYPSFRACLGAPGGFGAGLFAPDRWQKSGSDSGRLRPQGDGAYCDRLRLTTKMSQCLTRHVQHCDWSILH